MDYKDKSVCVVDNGLFMDLAADLAKHFGTVYYTSPWVDEFPDSNAMILGKGLPDVNRVDDIWPLIDKVDLWVFPDVYYGRLQLYLEKIGKRVWGARMGEELELVRAASKRHMEKLGIPVGEYVVLRGIDALREHLKSHKDQWVKISLTRGDKETFHSPNYKQIESVLDELAMKLGVVKATKEFIVERNIPDAIEIAYDGYSVDGQFPHAAMVGLEVKGKCYIGVFQDDEDMPWQITEVNKKLAPTLKRYRYRQWSALEMLITEDGDYAVTDPCARFGSPPGEVVPLMYTNLPDIFWHGADGTLVEPIPGGKYAVELRMESWWARDHPLAVYFPADISDHVCLRHVCLVNNQPYIVPQNAKIECIGSVVAVGDDLQETMDEVKEYGKQVEAYGLEIDYDSLDEAVEKIETLKSYGVEL